MNPSRRRLAPVLVSLLLASSAAPALSATAAAPRIDEAAIKADIKTLASDAFEGRGPASPGEAKTTALISRRFKALGLKPGGDHGGWLQAVPLVRYTVAAEGAKLAVDTPAGVRPLKLGEDAVAVTMRPVDKVTVEKAPLVFVGYGVSAPERHWDDFKGVDLHGKIAVVLINDPDFETPEPGAFDGKAMTYYGRWTYKYEELARRGALGAIIVHETPGAGYGWATVRNSWSGAQYDVERADPAKDKLLIQAWVQRGVAEEMLKAAGLDLDALKHAAQRSDFRPVELKGVGFSADYGVKHERILTHNVVALLPGKTRPKETVVYSAHWDHFGVGAPDASGDRIFHGAVDNASGVAALLELARLYAHQPRSERTVAFVAYAAEERGLLGSEYFAAHPAFSLAKTAAVFNMDSFATTGPARDFGTSGRAMTEVEDLMTRTASGLGRRYTPDPHPEEGHYFRSDHFPMAKVGVPAVSFDPGQDLVNGGTAAGEAWHKEYVAHRYHQQADRWVDGWDASGEAADLKLLYLSGRALANSRAWPQWKPGAEFAAKRAESAAERR